jgi:hypothetical protein
MTIQDQQVILAKLKLLRESKLEQTSQLLNNQERFLNITKPKRTSCPLKKTLAQGSMTLTKRSRNNLTV